MPRFHQGYRRHELVFFSSVLLHCIAVFHSQTCYYHTPLHLFISIYVSISLSSSLYLFLSFYLVTFPSQSLFFFYTNFHDHTISHLHSIVRTCTLVLPNNENFRFNIILLSSPHPTHTLTMHRTQKNDTWDVKNDYNS